MAKGKKEVKKVTDATMYGRHANIANNGFVATPTDEVGRIANLLKAETTYGNQSKYSIMVDPFAGFGIALEDIAGAVVGTGSKLHPVLVGSETNAHRAGALTKRFDIGVQSDAFSIEFTKNAAALLWLNPPYAGDPEFERLEHKALVEFTDILSMGGILIYIVPRKTLRTSARFLAEHYEDLTMYTFMPQEYRKFNQVVIVGTRKERDPLGGSDGEQRLRAFASVNNNVEPPRDKKYEVQFSMTYSGDKYIYSPRIVDEEAAIAAYNEQFPELYAEHLRLIEGSNNEALTTRAPLETVRDTYTSMLTVAGAGNKVIFRLPEDPEHPDGPQPPRKVMIYGQVTKLVKKSEEELDEKTVKVNRSEVLYATLKELNLDRWKFTDYSGERIHDYLDRNGPTILEAFRSAHPPQIDTSNVDLEAEMPDLLRTPKFRQYDAIYTMYHGLRSNGSVFLGGQTGCGKTFMALGVLAKGFEDGVMKRSAVVCPSHLTEKWMREARETVPNIRTVKLDSIAAVDRVIAEERVLDWAEGWIKSCPNGPWRLHPDDELDIRVNLGDIDMLLLHAEGNADVDGRPEVLDAANTLRAVMPFSGISANLLVNRDALDLVTGYAADVEHLAEARAGVIRRIQDAETAHIASKINMAHNVTERAIAATGIRESRMDAVPAIERGPLLMVISKETAKLGASLKGSYDLPRILPPGDSFPAMARNVIRIYDEEGHLVESYPAACCQSCGQPLWYESKKETHFYRPYEVEKKKVSCPECGAQAWTSKPLPSRKGKPRAVSGLSEWLNAVEDGSAPLKSTQAVYRREKGVLKDRNRYPIAERIKRHARRRHDIDLTIVDEAQHYKAEGSAQAIAVAMLAEVSQFTVAMTGTIYDGKASNLFYLLWRINQTIREEYGIDEASRFKRDFGFIRTSQKEKVTSYDALGGASRRKVGSKSETEIPQLHPDLLKLMLPMMVNVRLADVAKEGDLPPRNEFIVGIDMDKEQALRYGSIQAQLMEVLEQQLRNGSSRLLGAYLQVLLSCQELCFMDELVIDPGSGDVVVDEPGLPEDVVRPKEHALVEIVRNELAHGRRVMVFVTHSQERDIQPRLRDILRAEGFKAEIMPGVDAERREARIAKMLDEGMEVFIVNIKKVETGLDLLDFPSTVVYEPEYSGYVMRQGAGRAFRIGQQHPVHLFYLSYNETMQERALKIMSSKTRAGLALEGELQEGGLATHSEGDDEGMFVALARMLVRNIDEVTVGDSPSVSEAIAMANDILERHYADRPDIAPQVIEVETRQSKDGQMVKIVKPVPVMTTLIAEKDIEILKALSEVMNRSAARRGRRTEEEPDHVQANLFDFALSQFEQFVAD